MRVWYDAEFSTTAPDVELVSLGRRRRGRPRVLRRVDRVRPPRARTRGCKQERAAAAAAAGRPGLDVAGASCARRCWSSSATSRCCGPGTARTTTSRCASCGARCPSCRGRSRASRSTSASSGSTSAGRRCRRRRPGCTTPSTTRGTCRVRWEALAEKAYRLGLEVERSRSERTHSERSTAMSDACPRTPPPTHACSRSRRLLRRSRPRR